VIATRRLYKKLKKQALCQISNLTSPLRFVFRAKDRSDKTRPRVWIVNAKERPVGHYRGNCDPFSASMSVSNRQAKSRFDSDLTGSEVILGPVHSENNDMYYVFYVKRLMS